MKKVFILSFLIICIVISSCTGHKKHNGQEEQPIEYGKINKTVKCKKNVTHTYALYIPSNFDKNKKYPIIVCFDPHGNGALPLELLKDNAEKLGYILAGSNVSKNGLLWDEVSAHYDILLTDLSDRFSIDPGRIYTCGFSGGSRIASSVAIMKSGIAGVIGCSGGFPQFKQSLKNKFDYIGFAGSDDMNYAEMAGLDLGLEQNKFRHQFVRFDGTHGWPQKDKHKEAFVWTELNAMRDKKKNEDKNYIEQQFSIFKNELENVKKQRNSYDEYLMTKKIVNYFKGLADTKVYEESLSKLETDPAVKNGINNNELNLKRELTMQKQYGEKISTENAQWWKNEVAKLNTFIIMGKNDEEKHIVIRVLEYLSLASFSASSSLYSQGRYAEAEHYIELYAIIDTDNPEPEFMYAQIFARQNNADKTMEHLKKAAGLGFSEKSRIDNDTIFQKFNSDKRFSEITDIIIKNENQKQLNTGK